MSTIITPAPAYQKPSGKLYLSANQLNLVDTIVTLVELATIPAKFTDGIEDAANHRITPGVAGFYDVKGQVTFMNIIADRRYDATIRLNGTVSKALTISNPSITGYVSAPCSIHLYLSATDYLELLATSHAGVDTVDVWGRTEGTFLSVQRVR